MTTKCGVFTSSHFEPGCADAREATSINTAPHKNFPIMPLKIPNQHTKGRAHLCEAPGTPAKQLRWGGILRSAKNSENPQQSAPEGHPLDLAEGRRIRSTTVICVRRGDRVVMAADGQVSLGSTVMKGSAKKIRRLYNDKVLAGFAGSTADAFSLFSRFESKLEQYAGNLAVPQSSWRKTGARTRCSASLKRY